MPLRCPRCVALCVHMFDCDFFIQQFFFFFFFCVCLLYHRLPFEWAKNKSGQYQFLCYRIFFLEHDYILKMLRNAWCDLILPLECGWIIIFFHFRRKKQPPNSAWRRWLSSKCRTNKSDTNSQTYQLKPALKCVRNGKSRMALSTRWNPFRITMSGYCSHHFTVFFSLNNRALL